MDADLKEQLRLQSRATLEQIESSTVKIGVETRQAVAELQRMLKDEELYQGDAGKWLRLLEKLTPTLGKIPNVLIKGR